MRLALNHDRFVETTTLVKAGLDKGILCTVDFSESSKEALRWAVSLAKELKQHLTVLYTYRLRSSTISEGVELKSRLEKDAAIRFAEIENEILKNSGVSYDFKTEVGFVLNRVKDHAKKRGLSFWVMGSHINAANRESFDELASNIKVPLVIVPQTEA